MFYDADADPTRIRAKKVGIIGYGSQGHAHALNLSDNGVAVRVGLPASSASVARAREAGLTVGSTADVAKWADILVLLVPDTRQAEVYESDIRPHLAAGAMLMFAHGFAVRFNCIVPPTDIDVAMIAPTGPGQRLRDVFKEGGGIPALLAVHQDATSQARALALSYGWGIGVTRAGVIETTFAEETETDLFGEQAVVCGGASALIKAGFETLVDAGYQPEIAYFECMHQMKLIVDLMYRGGLNYMRHSISDTAEQGDYTAGPKIVTGETRKAMEAILHDITSGTWAREWIDENSKGRPTFTAMRAAEQRQPIETVGAELRAKMPFLNPVTIAGDD